MFARPVEACNIACLYASATNIALSKPTAARVALRPMCRGKPADGPETVSTCGLCSPLISVAPPCRTLANLRPHLDCFRPLKRALVLVGFAFRCPRYRHSRSWLQTSSTSRSRNLVIMVTWQDRCVP
jgi:hypothetical protein